MSIQFLIYRVLEAEKMRNARFILNLKTYDVFPVIKTGVFYKHHKPSEQSLPLDTHVSPYDTKPLALLTRIVDKTKSASSSFFHRAKSVITLQPLPYKPDIFFKKIKSTLNNHPTGSWRMQVEF